MRDDRLVSSAVLTERLDALEKWAKETGKWAGAGWKPAVDYVIADVRDAVSKAGDVYYSTSEVCRLTGWDRKTLLRHARAALAGEALPRGWSTLEVRRDASNRYRFRISTVPVRHRRAG